MKTIETADGPYVVFRYTEAGQPYVFAEAAVKEGPWFFEPEGFEVNDVYSPGYATSAEAEVAATSWAQQRLSEEAATEKRAAVTR